MGCMELPRQPFVSPTSTPMYPCIRSRTQSRTADEHIIRRRSCVQQWYNLQLQHVITCSMGQCWAHWGRQNSLLLRKYLKYHRVSNSGFSSKVCAVRQRAFCVMRARPNFTLVIRSAPQVVARTHTRAGHASPPQVLQVLLPDPVGLLIH